MAKASQAKYRAEAVAVPAPDTGGMLHSLRVYADFRLLLIGTLATNSAFWMYQVAVGWLALQTTDSPFFVGMTGFAGGIPLLVLSLPAGVAIDRFDRRRVLQAAQAGVMAVSALFALLIATDRIAPWSILALATAYGTAMSFVFPTRTAIVPSLVRRPDLANAIALNAAGQNATRVLGPSLAGVLIALAGVEGAFAFAAVMQILALVSTSRLPAAASGNAARGGAGGASLTLGLRIVAKDPLLVALVLLASITAILVMPYINLMPVFARDELGIGSTGLGVLLAATGLGSVAGALAVARSPRLAASASAQVTTAAGFAALVLAFAVVPVVPVAAVLLFAAGCASAAFLAINQTTMQLRVADEVRGRVLSVYLLTWGLLPLGQLAVGALADGLGAPAATAVVCALAIAMIAAVAWRYPVLRA